jgi:hypothetical protein
MQSLYRWGIVSFFGLLLPGCATWLHNAEGGAVEIKKIKDAIECELAAVARGHGPAVVPKDIDKWRVKSTLDLTLVATAGADGGFTYTLLTIDPMRVVPSAGVAGRDLSTAHVEFASSFAKAKVNFLDCISGPDPSGTGMGLAAWLESTLMAIPREEFGGMSFTTEFELSATAGGRFGYIFTRLFGDAGATGKLTHTHRLTVAINQPPGEPAPIAVYTVPNPHAKQVVQARPMPKGTMSEELAQPFTRQAPRQRRVITGQPPETLSPALRDPTLNRLLDNKRPLTLEDR